MLKLSGSERSAAQQLYIMATATATIESAAGLTHVMEWNGTVRVSSLMIVTAWALEPKLSPLPAFSSTL